MSLGLARGAAMWGRDLDSPGIAHISYLHFREIGERKGSVESR